MSHYNNKYQELLFLVDEIEKDFANNGKHLIEDWSAEYQWRRGEERPTKEADYLEEGNTEEKEIVLSEIKDLITVLKRTANRAKELEWFMSADTSIQTYIKRLGNL